MTAAARVFFMSTSNTCLKRKIGSAKRCREAIVQSDGIPRPIHAEKYETRRSIHERCVEVAERLVGVAEPGEAAREIERRRISSLSVSFVQALNLQQGRLP